MKTVLILTKTNGVFCGQVEDDADLPSCENITATNVRNCVYWSADVKGVLGLATTGPTSGCKIGPAVPKMHLRGVNAIVEMTDEAVIAWGGAPWSK